MNTVVGNDRFSPGLKYGSVWVLPVVALVQFFYFESLVLNIAIAVVLLFFAFLIFSAKYVYQFDEENRKFKKSVMWLYKFYSGEWVDFEPKCQYLAFQMKNMTFVFHFYNFFDTVVPESFFELRMVNDDSSYSSLLEVTDFNSIKSVLEMAKAISLTYKLPFKDFVKGQVKKRK